MAGIKGCPIIEVCDPNELFGSVIYPEESIGETMVEASLSTTTEYDGCRIDDATGLLVLAPKFAPKDMVKADWTTTGGAVKEILDRGSRKKYLAQTAAKTDEEWTAVMGASLSTTLIPPGGGYWLSLSRAAPIPGATESYLRIDIPTADPLVKYRIDWTAGVAPSVFRSLPAGGGWIKAGEIPLDQKETLRGGSSSLLLLVQILDVNVDATTGITTGRLSIRAGQGGDYSDKALILPYADLKFPVTLRGKNCNASWSLSPVTYGPGAFVSGMKEQSSANDANPTINVTGTTVAGELQGIDADLLPVGLNPYAFRYSLTLAPQGAAYIDEENPGDGTPGPDGKPVANSVTPWVRQVVVQRPSVQVAPSPNPNWTPVGGVEQIEITSEFVPGDMGHTVAAGASITLRNQEGQQAGPTGAKAMRIVGNLVDERAGLLWSQGLFIGYVNLRQRINPWSFVSEGVDRSVVLRAKKIHLDMYLDGQCIYHAVKRLAQRGGITDQWLHIAPNNPADAWTCDGQTCNHPRLPLGTAAEPLLRIPSGTSVWDALGLIAAGYIYGFTVGGAFGFYPWEPWMARDDWQPRHIYSMVPEVDFDSGTPRLNEILDDFDVTIDLTNTRNAMTLVGWSKETWEPFITRRTDPLSIAGGYGTPAYKGFMDEFAWSSSMFCDPAFTDAMASRMFVWMSQPEISASFRSWPLPLFALDYIGITGNRAWPWDDRWWVRRVHHVWDAFGGVKMDVQAGLIPYGLTSPPAPVPGAPEGPGGGGQSAPGSEIGTLGTTDENGNPSQHGTTEVRPGSGVAAVSLGDIFGTLQIVGGGAGAEETVEPYVFAPHDVLTADRLNTLGTAIQAIAQRSMPPIWVKVEAAIVAGSMQATATLEKPVVEGTPFLCHRNGQMLPDTYVTIAPDRLSMTLDIAPISYGEGFADWENVTFLYLAASS